MFLSNLILQMDEARGFSGAVLEDFSDYIAVSLQCPPLKS